MTPLMPRARVIEQIARYGGDILTHAAMQGTKNFPHHGQTSVFAPVSYTHLMPRKPQDASNGHDGVSPQNMQVLSYTFPAL